MVHSAVGFVDGGVIRALKDELYVFSAGEASQMCAKLCQSGMAGGVATVDVGVDTDVPSGDDNKVATARSVIECCIIEYFAFN